ncbi:MAG: hypothetical protein K2K53_00340 [Oscillospiraceae bacterium]|nr:hypothetical protein [Oscillospiraceae bacterium]
MPENCNPGDCPVASRVDALEREFDRYRSNSTETHQRMFDRIGALEQGSTRLEAKLDSIEEKLDELSATVKTLADKPAKRWEGLVDKAIWAVAAAVIAFLLGRIGL